MELLNDFLHVGFEKANPGSGHLLYFMCSKREQ
jgi:hypothetical protein